MNPIPFIVAAYAIATIVPAMFGFAAVSRMRLAERRLRALDQHRPRRARVNAPPHAWQ
ncbi:MAG: hypothetical protein ACREFO_00290 [Acetobacteraceae bacterium]